MTRFTSLCLFIIIFSLTGAAAAATATGVLIARHPGMGGCVCR